MANKDELYEDKSMAQQVHDAYDRVELSQEAQERMLGALLAAQREKGAREEPEVAPAQEGGHSMKGERQVSEEPQGEGVRTGTSQDAHLSTSAHAGKVVRVPWVPLAAAAAVVAALVVVGAGFLQGTNKASEPAAVTASESTAATDGAAGGTAQKGDTARESANAGDMDLTFQDSSAQNLADFCPLITLESGEKLTTYSDGQWLMEVDAAQVGDLMGDAAATAANDQSENGPVACKVYRLVDEPDGYAVRYDGEQSYWRCYPM